MEFPSKYKCLKVNKYELDAYALVPIRYQDRLDIMKWRNEQIFHLRQTTPLTIEDQNRYFQNVVAALFSQEKPNQILFSLLKNGACIGYGGLVHINWNDRNAEISFIMNTELEADYFEKHWVDYLKMIEIVAFKTMEFHKLFVYAFDVRPHLYSTLQRAGYFLDARLQEHCFVHGAYKDVLIYSKLNR